MSASMDSVGGEVDDSGHGHEEAGGREDVCWE